MIVESVATTHNAITITRHGKAATVLISVEDLQQLTDTVEWLNDPLTTPQIAEAEADIAAGSTLSIDDAHIAYRVLVSVDRQRRIVYAVRITHRGDTYRPL